MKEQLWLNWTNQGTNLILTCLGPLDLTFFNDDELLLTQTDLTEQTEKTEIRQLNDEDIDDFITENRNKNTTKKTQSDLNVFYRWAKTVNETRTLENIWEQELDKPLAHFVLNARKQTGTNMNVTH